MKADLRSGLDERRKLYREEVAVVIDQSQSDSRRYRRIHNSLQGLIMVGPAATTTIAALDTGKELTLAVAHPHLDQLRDHRGRDVHRLLPGTDGRFPHGYGAQFEFTEDCLTAVLAFRDRRVRARLSASVHMIVGASMARGMHGDESVTAVHHLSHNDIRQCLEARLDRTRLPKPKADWTEASESPHEYMYRAQQEMEAALEAFDLENEAAEPPGV
ncbi:hypothetical protein [Streptomyces lunaelactis]|uniref:hypothetical protein n=1 Tax=Streptomyces lunaelactis TaxID=1535768 RepID=UPI00131F44B8|nr:hypothetical protein [Streptomyces lunaelactis]NUK86798.1 hypothetical protein [Streptomyces lunaelactis]